MIKDPAIFSKGYAFRYINIGLWCNGNTTDFGSVISSSNLDSLTKRSIRLSVRTRDFHSLKSSSTLLRATKI